VQACGLPEQVEATTTGFWRSGLGILSAWYVILSLPGEARRGLPARLIDLRLSTLPSTRRPLVHQRYNQLQHSTVTRQAARRRRKEESPALARRMQGPARHQPRALLQLLCVASTAVALCWIT